MATTIVLVRHGETDWNRDNRFQGHADTPLNEAGRRQARELAADLEAERFAAVYSSPLRRAHETATILAERRGLPVRPSNALKEVDVGSWSGLTRTEIELRHPEGYRRWLGRGHGWDDGETYEDLHERVVAGLVEIGAKHPGETVLAVTHGGPIRTALSATNATDVPSIHNCFVVTIAVRDGKLERVD